MSMYCSYEEESVNYRAFLTSFLIEFTEDLDEGPGANC